MRTHLNRFTPVGGTYFNLPNRPEHQSFRTSGIAVLLLLIFPAAHTAHADVSLGAGRDVHFAPGTQGLFLNYWRDKSHFDFFVAAWRGQHYGQAYGFDYRCDLGRPFLAFGAAYLPKRNNLNGTKANFAIRLGYRLTRHWSLNWQHYSDGKFIFHWTSRPNDGWNFLTLDYTFGAGTDPSLHNCGS